MLTTKTTNSMANIAPKTRFATTGKCSFFNSLRAKTPFADIELSQIFADIKNGKDRKAVEIYRQQVAILDQQGAGIDSYRELKASMPAFTTSGTFSRRNNKSLIAYSGVICLDWDKNITLETLAEIKAYKHTYVVHKSVGGKGYAIYIKVGWIAENHWQGYKQVSDCYISLFGITPDNTIDISRPRVMSYDPDLYLNENAEIWQLQPDPEPTKPKKPTKQHNIPDRYKTPSIGQILREIASKRLDLLADLEVGSGEANSRLRDLTFALLSEHPPAVVKPVFMAICANTEHYNNTAHYTADALENRFKALSGQTPEKITIGTFMHYYNEALRRYNETTPDFWKIDSQKPKIKVEINENKLRLWLQSEGYKKYKPDPDYIGYALVKVVNNIVTIADSGNTKDSVINYIEGLEIDYKALILETVCAKAKALFEPAKIELLETFTPNWVRDTANKAFIFYGNGFVTVTRESATIAPYEAMGGHIWNSQILPREFTPETEKSIQNGFLQNGSDFRDFVWKQAGSNDLRFKAIRTALGYLMHNYKDVSRPWAIVIQDEVMPADGQAEGGTGKDLLLRSVAQFRKVCFEPGKQFTLDKNFAFQSVSPDCDIVHIGDVPKDFPFESLYNIITDIFRIEQKFKNPINLPYEKSPKIVITTNYPIIGTGGSSSRRKGKGEIEIAPYFNSNHSPIDEYGRAFFNDWQPDQWAMFDGFMLNNLQSYLADGLAESPDINRTVNALIAATEPDFPDFMDNDIADWPEHKTHGKYRFKASLYTDYCTAKNSRVAAPIFGKWFKAWAKARGYKFKDVTTTIADVKGTFYVLK